MLAHQRPSADCSSTQECGGDDRTALKTVIEADEEREWLLKMEKELADELITEEEAGISLNDVYERLEELDSDSAESNAATILAGLGFDSEMMQKPTREFSGGWRMRISLAQVIFLVHKA